MKRVARVWCAWLLLAALLPAGAAAGARLPRITAKAAIVVDHHDGKVLFERNADLQLPPASTTKLLTAYLAVRSGHLDSSLPVSRYASRMQPSKIWLRPGWEVNTLDLVYAILLSSANDASVVIAEGLGGSVSGFAKMMNEAARHLGATRSHFANPNGLPARGHYSTARDLVSILRGALRYPLVRRVLSTPSTVIRPTRGPRRRIWLRTHNRMLHKRRGIRVIGKTGYTRRARRCFAGAAIKGDREILFAVLGSRSLWRDIRRLVEAGFAALPEATDGPPPGQRALRPAGERQALRGPVLDGGFHVRLASFRARSRATGLRADVVRLGYDRVVVEHLLAGSRPLYRVTVRGFTTRADAQAAAATLARAYKLKPQVVSIGT